MNIIIINMAALPITNISFSFDCIKIRKFYHRTGL